MKLQGPARRLRIYIDDQDQWHGKPLYAAIVREARRQGLAGATVERGIMGYGAHGAIHEPHVFRLANNLPIVIELVDTQEKLDAFLPVLDAMMGEGMITMSEVEIITYGKG